MLVINFDPDSGVELAREDVDPDIGAGPNQYEVPTEAIADPVLFVWSTSARTLIVDVDEMRARLWAKARAIRDGHILGGCDSPLGRIDTDLVSQATIGAFAARAESSIRLSETYSVSFIMADNSEELHDEPALIDLNVALTDHLDACRINGAAIRAALFAATTAAALAVVDIDAGYPT